MPVTVSQLCELPVFQSGFTLLAGKAGLNKGVQHVTTMEVPDFAEQELGNELFVLTTFYSYRMDLANACETVRQLCRKKVSALAIKVNRFVDAVPPCIVEIAEEYEMPLFAVERNVAFREVIQTICQEIIDYQSRILRELDKQHEFFLTAILRGDETKTLIKIWGEKLQCFCACLSAEGKILAQYCPREFPLPSEDEMNGVIAELLRLPRNALGSSRMRNYFLFPCLAHNRIVGYLLIQYVNDMNERELLLTKQMVSYLSLKLLEKHLMFETEQRMIASIADEILLQHHSHESVVEDRVRLLGLTPQKYHFMILLSFRTKDPKEVFRVTLCQIMNQLKTLFPYSAVFLKASEIVAIVSFSDKSPYLQDNAVKRALSGIAQGKLANEAADLDMGVSLMIKDLRSLPKCYEQTKKALTFGRAFKPGANVFLYSEFIEKGLIFHSLGTIEHDLVIRKITNPLKEYDKKYNADLWSTLEKCLESSSLEMSAQELHIHSSTLRYRLQRVEEITGIDFFSPQGKFFLNLAYTLSKLDNPQRSSG